MKLIAFTGAMGSGKSTAIKCIQELQHNKIVNIKFAQPLYDMQDYIYNRIKLAYKRPQDFIKDRKLLQWLGTEWGRNTINQDLWTNIWKEEVKYAVENYPQGLIVVCDDVRFDNEADAVKSLGGLIVKIESHNTEGREIARGGITTHPSEAGVDLRKIDYFISNNGTVDDLKEALLTLNKEEGIW